MDKGLDRRKELLESELKSAERYRACCAEANDAVNEALVGITNGVESSSSTSLNKKDQRLNANPQR